MEKDYWLKKLANELGIPSVTLYGRINKLKKKGELASVDASSSKDMAALIEENRRLHKELMIAKEEKEILKKATYTSRSLC